jgi:hypothetical protein
MACLPEKPVCLRLLFFALMLPRSKNCNCIYYAYHSHLGRLILLYLIGHCGLHDLSNTLPIHAGGH